MIAVMRSDRVISTIDFHTAGIGMRLLTSGLGKLPGATIVRTETDADGNAPYEVHMVQQDGTPATVYVDKSFGVVSVQSGMPGPPQQANA